MPSRKNISAEEFAKQRLRDPEIARREREISEVQRLRMEHYRAASAPLLTELAELGFHLDLDALRTSGTQYKAAVPVLLKWLQVAQDPTLRESIIRLLSVPWAGPDVARALIAELDRGDNLNTESIKWSLGNAIAITADMTFGDEAIRLVQDKRLGKARQTLVLALANLPTSRAVDVLIQLLADGEVVGHAIEALGKLKALRAAPKIEPFLAYQTTWVRDAAKKALHSIKRSPVSTI